MVRGACLALSLIFPPNESTFAQSYESYREAPVGQFEGGKGVRAFRSRKNNVLKGSVSMADGGKDMRVYYRQYVFPAMTRRDLRDKLADLRVEIITDLASSEDSRCARCGL